MFDILLQTDLAAKVVKELRSDEHIGQLSMKGDTPQLDHTPMALPEDETQDPFTTIFMFYACKTLDFPPPVIVASTPQPYCKDCALPILEPTLSIMN